MQPTSKADDYISLVEHAINFALDAEQIKTDVNFVPRTKLHKTNLLLVNGMSTPEVRIFLNELVKEDTNYLEIGLYKGSTFASALYGNKFKSAVAIDTFEDFEGENGDLILQSFLAACKSFKIGNFLLIRNDSFNLTEDQKKSINDINLYFYDGGHSIRDHYFALKKFYDHLSNVFIFIVDDWAHPEAESGTLFALKDLKFKVHKQWILGRSQHDKDSPGLTWHNGLYVGVLEKQ